LIRLRPKLLSTVVLLAALATGLVRVDAAGRPDFGTWRDGVWPEAKSFGVSRKTFDAAFAGVVPDETLPDLEKPEAAAEASKGQAEFTRPPQAYVSEKWIARLAAEGRRLAVRHGTILENIERRFGVPAPVVLAIWGRETAYGSHSAGHDAIRALATQAYMGRRADMFRGELLYALKMLEDGVVERSKFRTSWAGAFGLTQFMPSEYEKLAVDFDGDGKRDIWSVPDALASAANQLKSKGWISTQPWGYEVTFSDKVTCAEDGPQRVRPLRDWLDRGVRRVAGSQFPRAALDYNVFPFSPGGGMGPTFLATENFLVFKRYNMSDLYALFVGHLADRIAGSGRFVKSWGDIRQLPSRQIQTIQTILRSEGYQIEKIDGRIGPNTRSQIGQYQLRAGLRVTCWPSQSLLGAMQARKQATGRR